MSFISDLVMQARSSWDSVFVRNVVLLSSGSSAGVAITLLATPVLTRLYSPAEMGQFGLFLSFFSVATVCVCLRLDWAIVSAETEEDAAALIKVCNFLLIPTSIIFGGLFLMFSIYDVLSFGELPAIAASVLTIATLWIAGHQIVSRFQAVRASQFVVISKVPLIQNVTRASSQVMFGFSGLGWIGMGIGEFLGRLFAWAYIRVKGPVTTAPPADLFTSIWKYKQFVTQSLPAAMVNSMTGMMLVPLISTSYGLDEAGQFSLAQRAWAVPMFLVGTAVADVFHSEASKLYFSSREKIAPLFRRLTLRLLGVITIPALLVLFFGTELIVFALGSEWETCGRICQLIVPWIVAQFVASPVSRLFVIYQKHQLVVYLHCATFISVLGAFLVCEQLQYTFDEMIMVLSLTMTIVYTLYLVLLWKVVSASV